MHLVDLSVLTKEKALMLSGEPKGVASREELLPPSLPVDVIIKVTAPVDLITITPSFVQGFFAQRMDKVGVDTFDAKLDISALPIHLKNDINDGLNRLRYRRKKAEH